LEIGHPVFYVLKFQVINEPLLKQSNDKVMLKVQYVGFLFVVKFITHILFHILL